MWSLPPSTFHSICFHFRNENLIHLSFSLFFFPLRKIPFSVNLKVGIYQYACLTCGKAAWCTNQDCISHLSSLTSLNWSSSKGLPFSLSFFLSTSKRTTIKGHPHPHFSTNSKYLSYSLSASFDFKSIPLLGLMEFMREIQSLVGKIDDAILHMLN